MKQAIGQTQIINFVLIFIAITFTFLIATLGYMKAFKVNSRIASHLEKYEGYNNYAKQAIRNDLNTLGYEKKTNADCLSDEDKYDNDRELNTQIEGYNACVKQVGVAKKGNYIKYKITTYVKFGPILGIEFKLPIRSQSEKIYVFN